MPSDVVAVSDLVRNAYGKYVARIGRAPAPMDVDYFAAIASGTVWVAEIAGSVGGIVVLQLNEDHLLIENVAVDPQWQGGGIGSQLLLFAEQHARDLGATEVRLYTNEHMSENLTYYARRGYVETGRAIEAGFARVYFGKSV